MSYQTTFYWHNKPAYLRGTFSLFFSSYSGAHFFLTPLSGDAQRRHKFLANSDGGCGAPRTRAERRRLTAHSEPTHGQDIFSQKAAHTGDMWLTFTHLLTCYTCPISRSPGPLEQMCAKSLVLLEFHRIFPNLRCVNRCVKFCPSVKFTNL